MGGWLGGETSETRVALERMGMGLGGETSEARVALARLGRVDSLLLVPWVLLGVVLGVLAMEEGSIGCLYLRLLDSRLLAVV